MDQTKAIFKSWFINNDQSSNWETGCFADLIQSKLNGDWGKDSPINNFSERVYCIRGADIPSVKTGNKGKMPTRYILSKNLSAKQLKPGDLVVEISGGSPTQSTGRVTLITRSLLKAYDAPLICTNFCKALEPIYEYRFFIYFYWQNFYDKGKFFSYENGTTGIKNLDFNSFVDLEPIKIPPKELIDKFNSVCETVFNQIFLNGRQSECLERIRDLLLPRLLSGQIEIK